MALTKRYHTTFGSLSCVTQDDGTVASGTAGESNLTTVGGVPWSYFVVGTNTTVVPLQANTGLDIVMTDTNGNGAIWTPYSNTKQSPLAFTIGTDPAFYAKLKVKVTDWSGCQLMFGFHATAAATATQQVHTATFADYTDKATIGNYAGGAVDVYTSTALNNAADVDTDTTINLTDADVAVFTVNVSAAGAVTYALSLNGTAQTLTTVAYTFDSGDTATPFLYQKNHTDTASNILLQELWVGYQ